jgi:hypothetical protein
MENVLFATSTLLHLALTLSVLGIAGAVLVAGLYDIVLNKVQGLRRQDKITAEASTATSTVPQHS